jgi:hypothetical protein
MTVTTIALANAGLVFLTVAALAAVMRLGLRLPVPADPAPAELHLGELADAA